MRKIAENFAESGDFHVTFGFFLHAVNLRHGTEGFTSPPKEAEGGNIGIRNCREFCRKWLLPRHFWVLFTCRKFTTWNRRFYFPSEGSERWKYWHRNCREFCRKWRLPRHFWVLLHAANLRHGTEGFTSPPKKGALRIFSPEKIRRLRPGLNLRTWVLKASTLTSRTPKPLEKDINK